MKKKIILGVVGLVLLIAGGISVYISTIDWNQHKDKIAAQFNAVTGKRVVFEGPVSFTLLPAPNLTARTIKIYNQNGNYTEEPLATIDSLVADLSLGALIQGNFEVKMMSLKNPEIWFKIMPDGTLNWQSPITAEQETSLSSIQVALDSVTLEKATVNFVDEKHDVNTQLQNLNGEVIAESIFGPYRIEGSYVKDKNPEGFAISLGQFSESFATSVNFVLNQPATQSYVRFDGSMLFSNNAVNGNLIIESQKLKEFVDSTFPNRDLDPALDYPLALSLELETSKTKIDMSNIVVKFGSSAGAGNIMIPLFENEFAITDEEPDERRRMEAAFNMTDLDLTPWVKLLQKFAAEQSKPDAVYSPMVEWDVLADLKSLKTVYNGQNIKDFALSADYVDNALTIRELSGILPGETTVSLKGDIFSIEELLTYNLAANASTSDLQKLLAWLGIEIEPIAPSTYRRATGTADISGTMHNIKISPLNVTIDKTVLKGEMGVVQDMRPQYYLDLSSDSVNFDNYIPALPKEELDKPFTERMAYRFKNLDFLNNVDLILRAKLDLGIYESVPFENTQVAFNLKQGVMDIENLKIGGVANSELSAEGKLSGFGREPQVTNMKYSIETKDFSSFLNKFELPRPALELKDLQQFSSKGIVTGDLKKAAMKTVSKLGYIDNIFSGRVTSTPEGYLFNGELEVKAPDFVKLVNDFNIKYDPKAYALGVFNLKANFAGNGSKFKATNLNANIGANNFQGTLWVDQTGAKPNIVANMKINRFELERFFYNGNAKTGTAQSSISLRPKVGEKADFLVKPFWDKTRINYDLYKSFTMKGQFEVADLLYQGTDLKNAKFNLNVGGDQIRLNDLSAVLNDGTVSGSAELNLQNVPQVKAELKLEGQGIDGYWSGSKYGLKSGLADVAASFTTDAVSMESAVSSLAGTVDLSVAKPIVKGWNFTKVTDDLARRDRTEGLSALMQDALQSGETAFSSLEAYVQFDRGRFTINDAKLDSEDVNLVVNSSGNLEKWDMESRFEAVLPLLPEIPPFRFNLDGSIESPELTVDVKAITDIYDSKWAKVAADKKAAEQARTDHLNELMNRQQDAARQTQNRLEKEVISEYEARSSAAVSEDAKEKFTEIKVEIDKLNNGLGEIFTMGLTKEFDESLPRALAARNEAIAGQLDGLRAAVTETYIKDLKYRINDIYNQVVDNYNVSKTKSNDYRDKFVEFPKRLAKIKTDYTLEGDKLVNQLKQDIENSLLAIDNIHSKASKDYTALQASDNPEELEASIKAFTGALGDVKEELGVLDDYIKRLFDYTSESIALEEQTYLERKKAEEQAQKVKENIGKISGTDGKSQTIVRDIDDIEKSEQLKKETPVKVLDFSADKDNSGRVLRDGVSTPENKNDAPENESGMVRKASGIISKPSGVIIKK